MDWDTYKRLADTPGVWSRWMLEQTLELLRHPQLTLLDPIGEGAQASFEPIAMQLQVCLGQAPIPQPCDHKGDSSLEMFRLSLALAQAQTLLALVQRATELGLTTSGTAKRGLAGFVAAWQEYITSIDSNDDTEDQTNDQANDQVKDRSNNEPTN
jgi:hypothetical protein